MRQLKDLIARRFMLFMTGLPALFVLLMLAGLFGKSRPILAAHSFSSLIFGTGWHPLKGEFGFLPFLAGTLGVTLTAMIIAVPISLLTAVYLSEYAPKLVADITKPVVDLLAGIPSVVYGVWGVLMVVPFVGNVVAPFFGASSSGYCVLSGGIVLAIMVFPTIIHVSLEVFGAVSQDLRDTSLALGATRWETVKHVVLRRGLPGIIAAVVLGVSRAFGETIAVLMVVGNVAKVPGSPFDGAYPLPALIANNYGEMMSVPLYDSALMLAALILLLVVLAFSVGARIILVKAERKAE
jgi:phosphate transport system permease protein